MKRRPDGRFLKVMVYKLPNGTEKRKYFYGYTENEIFKQIAAYETEQEKGRKFKVVAEDWKEEHYTGLSHNTQRGYDKSYKQAVSYFGEKYINEITPNLFQT